MANSADRFNRIKQIITTSGELTNSEAVWNPSYAGWDIQLTEHRVGFIVFKIVYSDNGESVRLFFQDQLLEFHESFTIAIMEDGNIDMEAERCIVRFLAGIQGNIDSDIERGFIPAD